MFGLQQQLMLSVSARAVILNWGVILVKLLILLPISLGAQLRNQHHICISQHWQHGRRTPVSLETGKGNSLGSLSLLMPKAELICH